MVKEEEKIELHRCIKHEGRTHSKFSGSKFLQLLASFLVYSELRDVLFIKNVGLI